MNNKNESEKLFEQYLDSIGLQGKWTYEPSLPGKSKRPDYLLEHNAVQYVFEVKELRQKPNQATGASHTNPYSSLRSEIDEARKKFKEFKEYSCSLVVYNAGDYHAILEGEFVFGAMLGDLGMTGEYSSQEGRVVDGSVRNAFLEGGKMMNYRKHQPQNTRISTIVVLEKFRDNTEAEKVVTEEMKEHGQPLTGPEITALRMKLYAQYRVETVLRVVVVENPFARIPFPAELFCGPLDERWRWLKEQNGKIVRVFVGDRLKEWEAVQNDHVAGTRP